MTRRARVLVVVGLLAALGAAAVLTASRLMRRAELARLESLLGLRDGMRVADVGAGSGWLAVEMARRVGPSGHVYATELDRGRLDDIREAARDAGLANVTVLQAGERATNLPAGCCDAVVLRRVYHHLSDPAAVTASIRAALLPGGRLAVIEFRREGVLGRLTGMGIESDALVERVGAAGFETVTTDEWPGWDHHVAVFRRP